MNAESQTKPKIFFNRVKQQLCKTETRMADRRTAKIWLQYLKMLGILRKFLRAERTRNWHMHLMAMKEMPPFLAASGHKLYAKSVYIFIYSKFKFFLQTILVSINAFVVVNTSSNEAEDFGQDFLPILSLSVKSAGGLTRVCGFEVSSRTQWLLSMPACSEINCAVQELTDAHNSSSEQHK
ncbi:hypothetical protein ElyMa_002553600 [Elysia marginata]|uniref:DUF4485 domain-containing protein n=1 Tax=Elysia marginata TaxID=1093978 RepID=A0AAV4GWQ7_9GAST|nr:hypothetical protein ElyMa_002553600 [Elysia marginata]